MRNGVRLGAIVTIGAGLAALATPAAAEVSYCSAFNNAYLTRILSDHDDCGSYPCGFYSRDFSDAQEVCGDEVFRVESPEANPVAQCDFCYWSNCWTVRKNTFGITAYDDIGVAPTSPDFRDRVLSAPSTQVIFRGGHGPVVDEPPLTQRVSLDTNRSYVFWLVQDHSLDEAKSDRSVPVFYSVTGANADGINHIISLTSAQNGGATAFSWEDLVDGGDWDFNDVVFTTQCSFAMRPVPPMTPPRPGPPSLPPTTDGPGPRPLPGSPQPPRAPQEPRSPLSPTSPASMPIVIQQ